MFVSKCSWKVCEFESEFRNLDLEYSALFLKKITSDSNSGANEVSGSTFKFLKNVKKKKKLKRRRRPFGLSTTASEKKSSPEKKTHLRASLTKCFCREREKEDCERSEPKFGFYNIGKPVRFTWIEPVYFGSFPSSFNHPICFPWWSNGFCSACYYRHYLLLYVLLLKDH
jgi:hypothetical protein